MFDNIVSNGTVITSPAKLLDIETTIKNQSNYCLDNSESLCAVTL